MFKVDITSNLSKDSVFVYGEKSLLKELEDRSILINHSCREGHCGSCIATIISGSVTHNGNLYPLNTNEILLCMARPTTDITIIVKY
jgi:ferredoxin/3-ketosteroid 9alpha-monooxygenase subunit B